MCSDKNPYEGAIAKNLTEMVEISEKARKYEHTGEKLVWCDLKTGQEHATSF